MRGCACRGTAGVAHVSCLVEQAKILMAEGEENHLEMQPRWDRWHTCSLCEQNYHGVVYCALGWACWKTYVGRSEDDQFQRSAMTQLACGLGQADRDEERLGVMEVQLAYEKRMGVHEVTILDMRSEIADCHDGLGRKEEALEFRREIYARYLALSPDVSARSISHRALCLSGSLNDTGRRAEAATFLRKHLPEARRALGVRDPTYLCPRRNYAFSLYRDDGVRHYQDDGPSRDNVVEAVAILEDTSSTARQILGPAHPLNDGIQRYLVEAIEARFV